MRFFCFSLLMICALGFMPSAQAQPVMLEANPLLAEPDPADASAPAAITPPATTTPAIAKDAPTVADPSRRDVARSTTAAPAALPDLKPDAVTRPDLGYAAPATTLSNQGESVISPQQEPWQRQAPRRRNGQTADQLFAKLPLPVQNQILEESLLVNRECHHYDVYSQFHDCECMGSTYFEERVFTPEETKDTIVGRISGQCASIPGAAGYGYDQCLAGMRYVLVPQRVDDYCKCYGNQFGKEYQKSPYPDFDNIRALSKRTNTYCLKNVPAAIKSLNP